MSSEKFEAEIVIQSSGAPATDQAVNYTWEWFKYHAEQRLTMTRYAITMIGGVAAGIGFFWKDCEYIPCALLSICGCVGALAAWRIDSRTSDIIQAAIDTPMQNDLAYILHRSELYKLKDYARNKNQDDFQSKRMMYSYDQILKYLYMGVSLIFILTFIVFFFKFSDFLPNNCHR